MGRRISTSNETANQDSIIRTRWVKSQSRSQVSRLMVILTDSYGSYSDYCKELRKLEGESSV